MKANHVGAPAIFELEACCRLLNEAFDCYGCYLVGSATAKADWRDVDVRMIMEDGAFAALFPDGRQTWEHDPRWIVLTCSISKWLSEKTGLPIDFQFQPATHANTRFGRDDHVRHALGLRIGPQMKGPTE